MRLPDADFQQLVQDARSRHNLSDVVGRYTDLKKRGAREQIGLCPFHSERTPSFEVNDDKGTYHCHGCGVGGDAITFLMKRDGLTFRQAIEDLTGDRFPQVSDEERTRRAARAQEDVAERIAEANEIWSKSVSPFGTPAEVYAKSRGIVAPLPKTIRFVETYRWRNKETGEVGRNIPALVCALQNSEAAIVGVQCIFLDRGGEEKYERPRPDGSTAKAKLSFGIVAGSALRLGPARDHIVLCEGPEDGLTLAQQMPSRSVWVSCGTAGLSRIELPDEVRRITLAGDNNAAGRRAVAEAHAIFDANGRGVQEVFPEPAFADWNDQLQGVRR